MKNIWKILVATLIIGLFAGCLGGGQNSGEANGLTGDIKVDGSSTVFPITEAVAEEFQIANPNVRVTVGVSGTGGGFKKFCGGETDISDASRPIKQKEIDACAANNIQYTEMPVAYDGLSVVVNPANDFAECMTVEELNKLWKPDSTVTKWSDIRAEWPDEEIELFGPGTDSGTFDYFTEEINGKDGVSRSDYTASEDDNVLVQGIAGEKNALGYFGYAYYVENPGKLKLVKVDGGKGCILPTPTTINDGSYAPLSRPIFIYPNTKSLEKPQVKEFVKYYLTEGKALVSEVGYIPLPDSVYKESLSKIS
ncbi:phosphate-binding protein PstS precursor [archaeon BMS3Abin16]|nr:phosphate-binding protein PstS precursor [archaeon BMS3Abin16]